MWQTILIYPKMLLVAVGILSTGPEPANLHPLHVSTTEANFNTGEKALEITCTLFTDDFEEVLRKNYKQKVDLISPAMHEKMNDLVNKYITTHLVWKVNGKIQPMSFVGFEIDKEVVNAYFEIPKINTLSTIETNNTLLYDLFDDQISIVHVSKGGQRKSAKVAYPERSFTVAF